MAQAKNVIPFPKKGKKDRYRRDLKWAPIKEFQPLIINFPHTAESFAVRHLSIFQVAVALSARNKSELGEVLAKMSQAGTDALHDDLKETKEYLRAMADVVGMVETRIAYVVRDRPPAEPEAA